MPFVSMKKTEWDKILGWIEAYCQQNKVYVYFDTRDFYLLIKTFLESGYKLNYTLSDIYETSKEGCGRSVTEFLSMDIKNVMLPNMLGSIRLLGAGQSKINISSQVFVFEDKMVKEDGFNADLRFEDINKLSITIGSSSLIININKSGLFKVLSKVEIKNPIKN